MFKSNILYQFYNHVDKTGTVYCSWLNELCSRAIYCTSFIIMLIKWFVLCGLFSLRNLTLKPDKFFIFRNAVRLFCLLSKLPEKANIWLSKKKIAFNCQQLQQGTSVDKHSSRTSISKQSWPAEKQCIQKNDISNFMLCTDFFYWNLVYKNMRFCQNLRMS